MNLDLIAKLNVVATGLADRLKTVHDAMEGKGVSPVHAPLVQAELKSIEHALRQLGGNPRNPVPFNG